MKRALLFLVLVLLLAGLAGGSLAAGPTPLAHLRPAAKIDHYLLNDGHARLGGHHSPLAGLGSFFMELGRSCSRPYHGALLAALAGEESSFALRLGTPGAKYSKASHNAWSFDEGKNHSVPAWPTYRSAARRAAYVLCRYYIREGRTSIEAIAGKYLGPSHGQWVANVSFYFGAMGGVKLMLDANPPSKSPHPMAPVKAHGGRVVNKHCSAKTLVLNDRGRCVRQLSWLYIGSREGPNVRPAKKAHGANADRRYWRVRSSVTSVYGHAMVRQTQTIKLRLGFENQRANGAAGPKLRRYLLGTSHVPRTYVAAAANRYRSWKSSSSTGAKFTRLVFLANYLIDHRDRIHYTQTMEGPEGRMMPLLYRVPFPPLARDLWLDCSAFAETLYIRSGLPDPAGAGAWQHYPSRSVYTGSQDKQGVRVWVPGQSLSRLHVGDLLFYGNNGHGPSTHTAVVITRDGQRVASHGSEPGPVNAATLYRDDAIEARRYFPSGTATSRR